MSLSLHPNMLFHISVFIFFANSISRFCTFRICYSRFPTIFTFPTHDLHLLSCSRSKFLSKIFKINVKNFREIFPDFTHRKKGSEFITVPFLSSGSHVLRLPSAFLFLVPCLEYTLSVLQQSSLTPHISGLYALLSN